jgi:hypothetical protein
MVENYFSEFQIPIAKLKKVYIPRQWWNRWRTDSGKTCNITVCVVAIHKRDDKTYSINYRGISQLSTLYEIWSNTCLVKLSVYILTYSMSSIWDFTYRINCSSLILEEN